MVDPTGKFTLQPSTPTQPMPAEEEINEKFAEVVVSSLHIVIIYLEIRFRLDS